MCVGGEREGHRKRCWFINISLYTSRSQKYKPLAAFSSDGRFIGQRNYLSLSHRSVLTLLMVGDV